MTASGHGVDRDLLGRVPIFGGLPAEVLDKIIEAGTLVDVAAGAQLIAEGELAKCVFVVCAGELEISKRGSHGAEVRLAVLRPADCVGEMSLIDIQPRSATVRARNPAVVFRLDHAEIARLYRSHPDVYMMLLLNIAREISRRLRKADQLLADKGVVVQEMWSSDRLPLITPSSNPRGS